MQWFNNLKLGVRLTASFVLLAMIVAFVGLRSRAAITDVGARMDWVNQNVTTSIFVLSAMRRELVMIRSDVWLLVAVRDPLREGERLPAVAQLASQKLRGLRHALIVGGGHRPRGMHRRGSPPGSSTGGAPRPSSTNMPPNNIPARWCSP